MPEALIEFFMDDTDERCWYVWMMVGLREEAYTDLICRFHKYDEIVNGRVQLQGT